MEQKFGDEEFRRQESQYRRRGCASRNDLVEWDKQMGRWRHKGHNRWLGLLLRGWVEACRKLGDACKADGWVG